MKAHRSSVRIKCGKAWLDGDLDLVERPRGLVMLSFASGGNQRRSAREAYVAPYLHETGFATLLFNLLTHGEDRLGSLRHNVKLLMQRTLATTHWVRENELLTRLPLAYWVTGITAAGALRAADRLGPRIVRTVVIRSARPDLAGAVPLEGLECPTLLIVGERDEDAAGPNRQAYERMSCRKQLLSVPNASHLFDEPGTMEFAARQGAQWISRWIGEPAGPAEPGSESEKPAAAGNDAEDEDESDATAEANSEADNEAEGLSSEP